MKRIYHYKVIGLLLSTLILLSCTSVEKKKDQESSPSSTNLQSQVEKQPTSESLPLPPPPPLLPLKQPKGAVELEALVSLSVTGGSLEEVLQALAEQAHINLIIDRDVIDENVTVSITRLPLWQALDAILTAHNLYFSAQPGYIRISRMMTKIFHIDYIKGARSGSSNTQVSLSSGSTGLSSGITTASGATSGGSTTTLGALGGSSSSGDITIQSHELVDFWVDFAKNLIQIMQDPLYEIIRSEYDQRDLKRNLAMLPYEEEYEREALKHQVATFRLQQELMQKRLETGVSETAAPPTTPATVTPEIPSVARGQEKREGTAENRNRGTEGKEYLVGTYSLDPQTGTLVVTTTPEVMARIEGFLSQEKAQLTRQVTIDVQILEVSLSQEKKLGVDWSSFPGLIQYYNMPHLASIIGSQMLSQATGGGGGGTTSGQGVTSPLTTSPFPTAANGSLQLGVLSTLGSNQAFSYSFNNVISFLKTYGEVNAVSRPQITTLNNQPAVVSVGVNDFYVTFAQETTAAQAGLATSQVTSQLNPIFIGVTLQITPQISPDGQIIMKIVPAVNKKVGEKTVPTGIPSSPTQKIPLLETRQTSTIVKAQSGETIIISGLIQETREEDKTGVPYFENIPWAGKLFRHTSTQKSNSELVVLLTPRISDTPLQMEELGYHEVIKKK